MPSLVDAFRLVPPPDSVMVVLAARGPEKIVPTCPAWWKIFGTVVEVSESAVEIILNLPRGKQVIGLVLDGRQDARRKAFQAG